MPTLLTLASSVDSSSPGAESIPLAEAARQAASSVALAIDADGLHMLVSELLKVRTGGLNP